MAELPDPGLQGPYEQSCVICLKPTETGLELEGMPEFVLAGVIKMGVPEEQAHIILAVLWGKEPGQVPDGIVKTPIPVCAEDADRAGMKAGLVGVPGGQIRVYEQEYEQR
jgi:hypothetical protein